MSEAYLVLKLKPTSQVESQQETRPTEENDLLEMDFKALYPSIIISAAIQQLRASKTIQNLISQDFATLYPTIMTREVIDQLRSKTAAVDEPKEQPTPVPCFDFDNLYPSKPLRSINISSEVIDLSKEKNEEITAVGPNVVPQKQESKITSDSEKEERQAQRAERRLDRWACSLYQTHARQQLKKSKNRASFEEFNQASRAARDRWLTFNPEAKALYLELAKDDLDQRQARKELFTSKPLPII